MTLVPKNDGNTDYTDDEPFELDAVTLTVAAGGVIESNGLGYGSESGPGKGAHIAGSFAQAGGGGYGGLGGSGGGNSAVSGDVYGDVKIPISLGSGGGNMSASGTGGAGGGAIRMVITGTLTINGTLSANGANGCPCDLEAGGGGSGGSVSIKANALVGSGTIQANGGDGGPTRYNNAYGMGGGGSGGRIGLECTTGCSGFNTTGKVQAYGGNGGQYGGAGTIYWKTPDTLNDTLVVDNNNNSGQTAGLISGNYTLRKFC